MAELDPSTFPGAVKIDDSPSDTLANYPGAVKIQTPEEELANFPGRVPIDDGEGKTLATHADQGHLTNIWNNMGVGLASEMGGTLNMAGSILQKMGPQGSTGYQLAGQVLKSTIPGAWLAMQANPEEVKEAGSTLTEAAKFIPTDVNKPLENTFAQFTGAMLPNLIPGGQGKGVVSAVVKGAVPAMNAVLTAGQVYQQAKDEGASDDKAIMAAAGGGAIAGTATKLLGLFGGKLFGSSPAAASTTWGAAFGKGAAQATGYGAKAFLDATVQNVATGELINASVPDANKREQWDIVKDSLYGAFPAAVFGAAGRTVEQIGANRSVSRAATQAQKSKADFIVDTAQAFDNIANSTDLSPVQKQAAVAAYLNNFSPEAQQAIVAHVDNVHQTVKAIDEAATLAEPTDGQTPIEAEQLYQQTIHNIAVDAKAKADAIDADVKLKEEEASKALDASLVEPDATPPISQETSPEVIPVPTEGIVENPLLTQEIAKRDLSITDPVVPVPTAEQIGPMTTRAVEETAIKQPKLETPDAKPVEEVAKPDSQPEATSQGEQTVPTESGSEPTPESIAPVASQPEEIKPEFVQDGDVHIDSGVESLPEDEKKAFHGFVQAAKKWGISGLSKFKLSDASGPAAVVPRAANFDTIFVDPKAIVREIAILKNEGKSDAFIARLNKARFGEEFKHVTAGRVLHEDFLKAQSEGSFDGTFDEYYNSRYAAIYDKMTQKQRKQMAKDYRGDLELVDTSKGSKEIGDEIASRFGEEYLRQMWQKREGITTEDLTSLRRNKPLRTMIKSVVERLKAQASKLTSPDSEINKIIAMGEKLIGEEAKAKKVRSVKPEGKTRYEQDLEKSDARREAVKDVPISDKNALKLQAVAQKVAGGVFSPDSPYAAHRDVAEANVLEHLLVRAKEFIKKNGEENFDKKFGAATLAANKIKDEISYIKTRQYNDNQDVTGEAGATPEAAIDRLTPRAQSNNDRVNANIQKVFSGLSPYEKRLIELQSEDPQGWQEQAGEEFGYSEAKVDSDFENIKSQIEANIRANKFDQDSFARMTGSAILQQVEERRFITRLKQDPRLSDEMKNQLPMSEYEVERNKKNNEIATQRIDRIGNEKAYSEVAEQLGGDKIDAQSGAYALALMGRLAGSTKQEDQNMFRKLSALMASKGTVAGQFIQSFATWKGIDAAGVLRSYEEILADPIKAAKAPFEKELDAINKAGKAGRRTAEDKIVEEPSVKDLTAKVEAAGKKARKKKEAAPEKPDESAIADEVATELDKPETLTDTYDGNGTTKNLFEQYRDSISDAVSKIDVGTKAKAKGAFEEFASRLTSNLKKIITEDLPSKPVAKALSGEATIREIYNNESAYKQAWDNAKNDMESKLKDDPEKLDALRGLMDRVLDAPVAAYDKTIRENLQAKGLSLSKIARDWATSGKATRENLIKSIMAKLDIKVDSAAKVEATLTKRLDGMLEVAQKREQDRVDKLNAEKAAREEERKRVGSDIPVWQQYKNGTFDAISSFLRPGMAKQKGAFEEFAGRFGTNLKALVEERAFAGRTKEANKPMGAEATIREIGQNFPEYQKAWDEAKAFVESKYAGDPEFLQSVENIFNLAMDVPAKFTNRLIADHLKELDLNVGSLIKEWAGSNDATRESLVKTLQDRLQLPPELAGKVGDALSARFNLLIKQSKERAIESIIKNFNKPELVKEAKSLAQRIVQAVNMGVPESEAAWNAVAEKFKLPHYSPEVASKLVRMANDLQRMKAEGREGFQTGIKERELLNMLEDEADKNLSYWDLYKESQLAVYYGNILGPVSIIRNVNGGFLNALADVGTMSIAETRLDPYAMPRAFSAMLDGLMNRGIHDAANVIQKGEGLYRGKLRYDKMRQAERGKIFKGIPGLEKLSPALSAYKIIDRLLTAPDLFFYAGAQEARANMLAYRLARSEMKGAGEAQLRLRVNEIMGSGKIQREAFRQQAIKEGLVGRDIKLRMAELAEQSRPKDIRDDALDFGLRATFMNKPEGILGGLTNGFANHTNTYPSLKYLVPFTHIIANVFNNNMAYTPFGIGAALRFAREGKNDLASQQYVKMLTGAVAMLGLAVTMGNSVQGNGPIDYKKRQQLLGDGRSGWAPYSIKIGDKYISYRDWPIASALAAMGTWNDAVRYGEYDKKSTPELVTAALMGITSFMFTNTWLSNVKNVLDAMGGGSPDMAYAGLTSLAGNLAGGLIPGNQSGLKLLDKLQDADKRKPNSLQGMLVSQIAVARRVNAPALNALGDPIQERPFQVFGGVGQGSPIWQKLSDHNLWIAIPDRKESLGERDMTDDEYQKYVKTSGSIIKEKLMDEGLLDRITSMNKAFAQTQLSRVVSEIRGGVKKQIMREALDAGTLTLDTHEDGK